MKIPVRHSFIIFVLICVSCTCQSIEQFEFESINADALALYTQIAQIQLSHLEIYHKYMQKHSLETSKLIQKGVVMLDYTGVLPTEPGYYMLKKKKYLYEGVQVYAPPEPVRVWGKAPPIGFAVSYIGESQFDALEEVEGLWAKIES